MAALVLSEVKNGVGFITLNRPDAFNAINLPLANELQSACENISQDASVRAVLIRGSGKHFCVGGDIKWFTSLGDKLPEGVNDILAILNPVLLKLLNLRVPVVTAVQGVAAGAGGGLALAGDIVLSAQSSQLHASYSKIGLSPDLGFVYSMMRRIGLSRTKAFFLLGRSLDAEQCLNWDVFNAVYPDDQLMQAAEKLVAELATGPTRALECTKQLINRTSTPDMEDHLALERRLLHLCASTHDAQEGIQSFLENRKPYFIGS